MVGQNFDMAHAIRTVSEAVDAFTSLKQTPGLLNVFRGHANYAWKLNTLITRSHPLLREKENELVRELVSIAPKQFESDVSMFDRLVRMQHFGLPTRLMDTTSNPLVALYFATEDIGPDVDGAVAVLSVPKARRKYFDSDTVSCIANLANLTEEERASIEETSARAITPFNKLNAVDRLVQFVRSEKPSFRPRVQRTDLFKRLHVVPKMSNPRIVAQSGSFILFGLDRQKLPEFKVEIKVIRLRIAADAKHTIRKQLAHLGVTESSLFPELDRAASNIVQRLSEPI